MNEATNTISHNTEIDIDIDIQSPFWKKELIKIEDIAHKVSEAVFAITGFDQFADHIEFSMILTDDKQIQLLNKDYRGMDKATNVLSFPAEDIFPKNFKNIPTLEGFILIGDIVFAYETLKSESENLGKTFESHFFHLLVHGLLHLLGYDHETDEDADAMEGMEINILSKFNIKSPYIDL